MRVGGAAWRTVRLKVVSRSPEVGDGGPERGLVGLGAFRSEADGDPQGGLGQRENTVRFAFLIQQFGYCVKEKVGGRTMSFPWGRR